MNPNIKRRVFVRNLSAVPIFMALGLAGCDDDDNTSNTQENTPSTSTNGETGGDVNTWASGGTDLIRVDYPDDSVFNGGNTCTLSLTPSTTEGPCYFQDSTQEDISEGLQGLPMQLCLRLVDSSCNPLPNHTIEVWHCDTEGVYSGDTSNSADASRFAGDFCTGGSTSAESSTWYRGQLVTDSSGRVNFKSCFPGWYRGRTIHIHYSVTTPDGRNQLISQFCFTDEFCEEICTTHDRYAHRGSQDQPLSGGRDTVFPSSGYEDYLLATEQNSDGSLLAYHTIQIA